MFTVRINSKSFHLAVRCVQERYLSKFSATSDVSYCVERYIDEKQTELKLKISNTADNAGITQSQVRDTMHRRMYELNSLCVNK